MASLPDGTYIIHNAAQGYASRDFVLDVRANQTVNGTPLQIWLRNNTDAQIWEVTTRRDGTRQITSRFCGKSVDVLAAQTSTSGQPVQLFDDNDTIAQQWYITDAGSTISYSGSTYNLFYICVNSAFCITHEGFGSEGSEMVLLDRRNPPSEETLLKFKWFFEPVPLLREGGVYEIRTYLNPRMGLEVVGGTANGANVQLNYASDRNTMKFILMKESNANSWSLCNGSTGKFVDVDSALAVAGANVQQWDDNDTRAQRWKIVTYGETTVDGVKCLTCRFGSYVTNDGQTFMMDVSRSDSSAGNNVQIWGALNNDAQLFILVPATTESVLPTPYNLGISTSLGGPGNTWQKNNTETEFFPTFQCSSSWVSDGNNHFEWRWRKRWLKGTTNTWQSNNGSGWGAWKAWATPSVYKQGNRLWISYSLESEYDFENYDNKHEEFEFQVRPVVTNGYSMLHGTAASAIVHVYHKPDVSITDATFSPEGLRLGCTTDYPYGTTYITVNKIKKNGTNILDAPVRLEIQSATDSDLIEIDKLNTVPTAGTYSIEYQVGYDQMAKFNDIEKENVSLTYDGGNFDCSPTLVEDGLRLFAVAPALSHISAWVTDGRQLLECPRTTDYAAPVGSVAFDVPFAMGKESVIFVSTYSDDETQYGAASAEWANDYIAHGFTTLEGHSAFLHKFVGAMPTMSRNRSSVYEADVLDARIRESISFNGTVKSTLTAYGDLLKPDDYSTIDDFEFLEGKHAIFRDLYGDTWQVAITSIDYTRNEKYDRVTVSMIEESV